MSKQVLISGAAGDTGRAAVRESLALGLKARALVRKLDDRSDALQAQGAEVVVGDLIAGIAIPDSSPARAAAQLVRDTETDLLFHHSNRVFLFGALTGSRRGLRFDSELLYVGALFHDMGLMLPTAVPTSASKSMVPTRRAISCAATASARATSSRSGMQSPCTPRPAFRCSRSPWWRW